MIYLYTALETVAVTLLVIAAGSMIMLRVVRAQLGPMLTLAKPKPKTPAGDANAKLLKDLSDAAF